MSEVVNQADECLLLFPLWTDRTAPCAKLMRELQSSQCIKWDHRIDLFYQDYTPLWKKDQKLLQEFFHTEKKKSEHPNPPQKNNNKHVLKRWKRYTQCIIQCLCSIQEANPHGSFVIFPPCVCDRCVRARWLTVRLLHSVLSLHPSKESGTPSLVNRRRLN